MIQEQNGLTQILTVLEKGVSLKDTEGAELLRSTAAGLLLNFLDGQTDLQHKVDLKKKKN